jgi:NitT/TauT family transport system ATP-binding protein
MAPTPLDLVTAHPMASSLDPSPEPKISAHGVARTFGTGASAVQALGPLDLDIAEGEFLSLVGPSGCGKSTFVRLVAGLLKPTAGTLEVRLSGQSRAPIATVFQNFGIFPWMTVLGNVKFALRSAGVPHGEAVQRSMHWLERLGLQDFAKAYPETLSGGMRQRVAIARALATEPEIMLMDEPFAALDAQMREMLQEELLQISQTEKRTFVFVTHSLEEALVLADRVVLMTARPGRVLQETITPFGRPRDPDVREQAAFGRLRLELWEGLRGEVMSQMGQRTSRPGQASS